MSWLESKLGVAPQFGVANLQGLPAAGGCSFLLAAPPSESSRRRRRGRSSGRRRCAGTQRRRATAGRTGREVGLGVHGGALRSEDVWGPSAGGARTPRSCQGGGAARERSGGAWEGWRSGRRRGCDRNRCRLGRCCHGGAGARSRRTPTTWGKVWALVTELERGRRKGWCVWEGRRS